MDSERNFLSPNFKPLVALRTPNLQPPIARVAARDNITRCQDLLPENDVNYRTTVLVNKEAKPICMQSY